jgi:hypothetical protein
MEKIFDKNVDFGGNWVREFVGGAGLGDGDENINEVLDGDNDGFKVLGTVSVSGGWDGVGSVGDNCSSVTISSYWGEEGGVKGKERNSIQERPKEFLRRAKEKEILSENDAPKKALGARLGKRSNEDFFKNISEGYSETQEIEKLRSEIALLRQENLKLKEVTATAPKTPPPATPDHISTTPVKSIIQNTENMSRQSQFITPIKKIKVYETPAPNDSNPTPSKITPMKDNKTSNLANTTTKASLGKISPLPEKDSYREMTVLGELPQYYKTIWLENGDTYFGSIVNNQFDGYGTLHYNSNDRLNRIVFKGHWKLSKREGYGTLKFENGSKFKGTCRNDMANGPGSFFYHNREKYTGDFEDDRASGYGEFLYLNGDVYRGNWKDNVKSGYGEILYKEGEIISYKGNFEGNQRNGYGELAWRLGSSYRGNFVGGQIEGFGEFRFCAPVGCQKQNLFLKTPGAVYTGDFKFHPHKNKSYIDGQGKLTKLNGDTLTGCFAWNRPVGFFEISYACTKDLYKGNIGKSALHNGFGTIKFKNGDSYKGNWQHGKRSGLGELTYSTTGDRFTTVWENDYPANQGILRYKNGDIYDGQWSGLTKHGFGKLVYHNGTVFTGNFCYDEMEGSGKIVNNKGETFNGNWEGGQLIGFNFDDVDAIMNVHKKENDAVAAEKIGNDHKGKKPKKGKKKAGERWRRLLRYTRVKVSEEIIESVGGSEGEESEEGQEE